MVINILYSDKKSICFTFFFIDLNYFINDEQANKVKTNQDQLDIDLTICGENIIEQIKTLVEDYKQKDLRIKVLEEYILSLQKQIEWDCKLLKNPTNLINFQKLNFLN